MVDAIELGVRVLEMVEQPARRRDEDVDARAKRVLLRPHADAAEDRGRRERRVDGELLELLEDLRGELARGREDQRARGAALLLDQVMQDRKQKRRGLAAAGLRAGEQIAAFERGRNGVGLNGRRPEKAELFDTAEKVAVKV